MNYFEVHVSHRAGKLYIRPDRLIDTVSTLAGVEAAGVEAEILPGLPGVQLLRDSRRPGGDNLLAVAVETDIPVMA